MRVAVIGAGGHGKVILDAILIADKYTVAGIVDDNIKLSGKYLYGLPIVDDIKCLSDVEGFLVAIGNNRVRRDKYDLYMQAGYKPVSVIHPSAVISPRARVGKGTAVLANAVVNTEASIGDNVVLYTSCTLDHDCIVSDHAYISPGCNVCGQVIVEIGAMLGAGAVILPKIHIGEWSTVGAGSVVNRDVHAGTTVVGAPAKILRRES
jgi:acetyltransferase EpsM